MTSQITPIGMNRQQAAYRVGVHVNTIDAWLGNGTLRAKKVGSRWFILVAVLDALIAAEPEEKQPEKKRPDYNLVPRMDAAR